MGEESPLLSAQEKFIQKVPMRVLEPETIAIENALNRITYRPLHATADSPPYHRAIVEGFVVSSQATQHANESNPVYFEVIGHVLPGDNRIPPIAAHQAYQVATGSAVDDGDYAVVRMWEAGRDGNRIAVKRPFPPRFFVEDKGCEIKSGAELLPAGQRLKPANIGALASLGVTKVEVVRQPKVVVFSSGNEVIPHTEKMRTGAIYDCNAPMLQAACMEAGAQARFGGIMPDDFDAFVKALRGALLQADLVVISGGTAVGGRDFVSDLIRAVGELIVDGVPMRSGRPLIMGIAGNKPIVGVAGHPPEALRGFRLFAVPALAKLGGEVQPLPPDHAGV